MHRRRSTHSELTSWIIRRKIDVFLVDRVKEKHNKSMRFLFSFLDLRIWAVLFFFGRYCLQIRDREYYWTQEPFNWSIVAFFRRIVTSFKGWKIDSICNIHAFNRSLITKLQAMNHCRCINSNFSNLIFLSVFYKVPWYVVLM